MSSTGRAKGFAEESAPARFGVDRMTIGTLTAWKLEDAKARFSEVVRRAREQGPQRVTYHGKDAVVVIAVFGLIGYWLVGRKASVVDFMIATEGEMKKVNWSSRREILGSTWVVIALTAFIALFCFAFDRVFQQIFTWIDVLEQAV